MTKVPVESFPKKGSRPSTDFCIGSVLKRTRLVLAPNLFSFAGIAGIAVMPGFIVPARDGYAPVDLGLPTSAATSIFLASSFLGQSILCFVACQRMRGLPIDLNEGLRIGLRSFSALIGLFILVILGSLQLLSDSDPAVVIVGVIFLPIWLMAMPICVIERLGPIRGFGRSWALTKGHRSKVLVLMLLVIVAGVGLLATMRLLMSAVLSFGPRAIVGPVARIEGLTWTALWTAFLAVLLVVFYDELRVAKGGNEADQLIEVFE